MVADREDQTAVGVSGGVIYGGIRRLCVCVCVCVCGPHYLLLSPITRWIYGRRREAVKSPVVRQLGVPAHPHTHHLFMATPVLFLHLSLGHGGSRKKNTSNVFNLKYPGCSRR